MSGTVQQCLSGTLYSALTDCESEDQTCISTDEDLESTDAVWHSIIEEKTMKPEYDFMTDVISDHDFFSAESQAVDHHNMLLTPPLHNGAVSHPDGAHAPPQPLKSHSLKVHSLPFISNVPVLTHLSKNDDDVSNLHGRCNSINSGVHPKYKLKAHQHKTHVSDCTQAVKDTKITDKRQNLVLPPSGFSQHKATSSCHRNTEMSLAGMTVQHVASSFYLTDNENCLASEKLQPYYSLSFHKCIKYYKEVCDKLTKEKDKLEIDKEHIKRDLCTLQTEIQGNEKAVKSLQQTMDRLQKSKKKLNKVHEVCTIGISHCGYRPARITNSTTKQEIKAQACVKKAKHKGLTQTAHQEIKGHYSEVTEKETRHLELESKEKRRGKKTQDLLEISKRDKFHRPEKLIEDGTSASFEVTKKVEYETQIQTLQLNLEASQCKAKLIKEEMLKIMQETDHSHQLQLKEYSTKLLAAENELLKSRQHVTLAEEELKNVQEKAKRAENKCHEAERKIQNLEKKMELIRKEATVTQSKLQTICEEKELEIKRLETKVVASEEKLTETTLKANALKEEVKRLYIRAEIAESKCYAAEERVDRTVKQITLCKKQALIAEHELQTLCEKGEHEKNSLELQLSTTEEKFSNTMNEVHAIKKELKTLHERAEIAESKCCTAQRCTEKIEEEFAQYREKAMVELQTISEEKEAEKKQLEQIILSTKEKLFKTIKETDKCRNECKKLNGIAEKNKQELLEETKRRKAVEAELQTLHQKVEELNDAFRNEHKKIIDRAERAEKELIDETKRRKSELQTFQKKAVKTEEELNGIIMNMSKEMEKVQQKKDKKIKLLQVSAKRIQELERRVAKKERELETINQEAEVKLEAANKQLKNSEEMMTKLQAKIHNVHARMAEKERELAYTKDIADKAKRDLTTVREIADHNEKTLRGLVHEANKVSMEAVDRTKTTEKLLKEVKQSENEEQLAKLLKAHETRISRTEMALNMAEKNLTELQKKENETSQLKQERNGKDFGLDESSLWSTKSSVEEELQKLKVEMLSLKQQNSVLSNQVAILTSHDTLVKHNAYDNTAFLKSHEALDLLSSEGALRYLKNQHPTNSGSLNQDSNSIQHQIHDKMARFISSLKNAQDLLHVDDKPEATLHDLEVKSSHRFWFHSEDYIKLNGIKKWLTAGNVDFPQTENEYPQEKMLLSGANVLPGYRSWNGHLHPTVGNTRLSYSSSCIPSTHY